MGENIIHNSCFDMGLHAWHANSCSASLSDGFSHLGGAAVQTGGLCAIVSNRKASWQGLEQDITDRVKVHVKYFVTAIVGIVSSFQPKADVLATLRLERSRSPTSYTFLGKVEASTNCWAKLEGNFVLDVAPEKAVFYLEGPPPAVDIIIKYVEIRPFGNTEERLTMPQVKNMSPCPQMDILLLNPEFAEGLLHWSGKSCRLSLHEDLEKKKIVPLIGTHFVAATHRTQGWQGIEQEITGRLKSRQKYEVFAYVRISGDIPSADVLATCWLQTQNGEERYISLGKVRALTTDWVPLRGSLLVNFTPKKALVYLEGPPGGINLLVDSFSIISMVKPHAYPPEIKNPRFNENVIGNSDLSKGLTGWYALGSCSLVLGTGAPQILPAAAKNTLGLEHSVSGYYVIATNRKYIWEGPAQTLTGKLQTFVTYQVSAWVKISSNDNGPQKINVALGVDGEWINGGEIEGNSEAWCEIAGSFRLEHMPEKVIVYVQGPCPGVDLMVAGLRIFAVDRKGRFPMLKEQTNKVRKHKVILHVQDEDGSPFSHMDLKVNQVQNKFPLGSCINKYSLENDLYVQFFLKHFNWAVFENEMKWNWTEGQQGQLNYKDADALYNFCSQHGIPLRGHCIFWETEDSVQEWLKKLNQHDLQAAIQSRIVDLVSRYSGMFRHYDVNNEMLHGSFYKDRLGSEIFPYMFKLVHQFDPAAKLFVNDYHVEDGYDAKSSPEKYIEHIRMLQMQGAPIGGIGLQGHVHAPVGAVICSALDKLAMLGLPIWLTEVDVASLNEFVRAEDLEVVLREAFAHPAVQGIMLWGFWEHAMNREHGHLVDADGVLTEAGKIFRALKQEWLSTFEGRTDDKGLFTFEGYQGSYMVSLNSCRGPTQLRFEVTEGVGLLDIELHL